MICMICNDLYDLYDEFEELRETNHPEGETEKGENQYKRGDGVEFEIRW